MVVPSTRTLRSAHHFKDKSLTLAEPSSFRSHPSDTDEALLAVASGDREAFSRLYDAVSPLVFGLCKRIVRSQAIAEEVTQEVFLEIWHRAVRWRADRSSALSWILMVARSRAIDRVRSEQSARDRQEKVGPSMVEPDTPGPAEGLEVREEQESVRTVLETLSEKQRLVIELAYYQGKTYVEVADELDLPLGTVKTRMRDGLLRMREIYGVER